MAIEPYLFFNGRCDEAIAFYRDALGAEVQMLMRFREHAERPLRCGLDGQCADLNLRTGQLVSDR